MTGCMSLQCVRGWRVLLGLALLTTTAARAGEWATPRVMNAQEFTGSIEGVVTPRAYTMAIHEEFGYLIVGHRADADGRHLSVFVLDDAGQAGEDPVRVSLPAASGTEQVDAYPLSLALHPQLPLLYVFCDALPPADNAEEILARTYRLHVFLMRPGRGGLTLLRSTGEGTPFAWERSVGLSAIDAQGRHLFLPHARDNGDHALAYVPLDRRGMPRTGEDEVMTVITESVRTLGRGFNPGLGYVAGSPDAVVFAAQRGAATWDLLNRRARLVHFPVNEAPGTVAVGGRPDEVSFYMVGQDTGFVARMSQAHGYVTLLPQIITLDERLEAALHGPPVPMPGAGGVAVAGRNGIYVFDVKEDGRLGDHVGFARLQDSEQRILAWSERFQTLYTVNP